MEYAWRGNGYMHGRNVVRQQTPREKAIMVSFLHILTMTNSL